MPSYGSLKDLTNLSLMLTAIWERELVTESVLDPLYNVQTSERAVERTQGMDDFGLIVPYNGSIEYDEIDLGDRKEFEHVEYARGLVIPRKLVDDDEYNAIATILTKRAQAFSRTVTYHKSAVFNKAFATTYTTSDGKALCDSTRTSGKAVLGNKGTTALSHDAVVSTRRLMRQFKDANGLVVMNNPDTLVVPVALEGAAIEIVQSAGRSDNANNATNSNRGLNLIVDPLLDDSNNWFMVDSVQARNSLWWWWRVQPEFVIDPTSEYELGLKTRGYMRYSFGADNHTWIYGHEVA
jgi:hypothetical protein